jgi:hypothetical protein
MNEYNEYIKTGEDYIPVSEYAKKHSLTINKVRGAIHWGYFEHKIWRMMSFNTFIQKANSFEQYIHKDTDFYGDRKTGKKFKNAKERSNSYYEKRRPEPKGVKTPIDMLDVYLKTAKRNGHEVDFDKKTIDGFEITKTKESFTINGIHISHYIYNEKFDFDD